MACLVSCSFFRCDINGERARGVVIDILCFCWHLGVEMTILGNNRQQAVLGYKAFRIYDEATFVY